MKVFSACLKITKRRATSIIIYLVLFLALSVLLTSISYNNETEQFNETNAKISIINRDTDSLLINGLIDYIKDHSEYIALNDNKQVLQDALFYHSVDYILFIPDGFTDSFHNNGDIKLQKTIVPDSAKGYYADNMINQYLSTAKLYYDTSLNMDEQTIIKNINNDLSYETQVTKKIFGDSAPIDQNFLVYYRMMGYILVVLIILGTSTIMLVFNRPDLRMRNICSPMKLRSINFQLSLSTGTLAFIFYLFLVIFGFAFYGSKLAGADIRIILLLMLNMFVYTIVSLSIGFICGIFIKGANTQNAAANFISLFLSFLGGVLVPLEFIGSNVVAAAHFIPTYWYVSALNKIGSLTNFTWQSLSPAFIDMLIQLGFAAAIFSVALVVSRSRRQSNLGFYGNKTEIA